MQGAPDASFLNKIQPGAGDAKGKRTSPSPRVKRDELLGVWKLLVRKEDVPEKGSVASREEKRGIARRPKKNRRKEKERKK